jgi:6-phosphogluconolactonase
MSVRWHTYPDPAGTAAACAHHITAILDEVLSGQEFATLAVSGGSTPKLLFDELVKSRFEWTRVHLFWVDERCVPPTDPASNFKLANDYLIKPAHIPQRHLHRICGEMRPDAAAKRYVDDIREHFGLEAGELPHFDVIQRGMGADAHSASLFPGEPLIDNREDIAAAVYSEAHSQWRVTLLPGVLLAARHTVFLVCGADKAPSVRAVFQEEYDPKKYPAQIGSYHGRAVAWFLDTPAAALMD